MAFKHLTVLEHPVARIYWPVAVWLLLRLLSSHRFALLVHGATGELLNIDDCRLSTWHNYIWSLGSDKSYSNTKTTCFFSKACTKKISKFLKEVLHRPKISCFQGPALSLLPAGAAGGPFPSRAAGGFPRAQVVRQLLRIDGLHLWEGGSRFWHGQTSHLLPLTFKKINIL